MLGGNRKVKVAPLFSRLEISIEPPWASTMALQIDRPNPLPEVVRALSPR